MLACFRGLVVGKRTLDGKRIDCIQTFGKLVQFCAVQSIDGTYRIPEYANALFRSLLTCAPQISLLPHRSWSYWEAVCQSADNGVMECNQNFYNLKENSVLVADFIRGVIDAHLTSEPHFCQTFSKFGKDLLLSAQSLFADKSFDFDDEFAYDYSTVSPQSATSTSSSCSATSTSSSCSPVPAQCLQIVHPPGLFWKNLLVEETFNIGGLGDSCLHITKHALRTVSLDLFSARYEKYSVCSPTTMLPIFINCRYNLCL